MSLKVYILICFLVTFAKTAPQSQKANDLTVLDVGHTNSENEGNKLPGSPTLFEGDIMMSKVKSRMGARDENLRWPLGVVPYYINVYDFTPQEVLYIEAVMRIYHKFTCVQFRPIQNGDVNFIHVKGSDKGCYSSVGNLKQGGQIVNLGKGCLQDGVILHELMHAIGFWHQQSSADRDDYVDIYWENMDPKVGHNFFRKGADEVTDFGYGYDLKSLMHYDDTAFSINGVSKTILPKNLEPIKRQNMFSKKDILKINEMYKSECSKRDGPGKTFGRKTNKVSGMTCSSPGVLYDPADPKYYYRCWYDQNGLLSQTLYTCPQNYVYDASIDNCVFQQ